MNWFKRLWDFLRGADIPAPVPMTEPETAEVQRDIERKVRPRGDEINKTVAADPIADASEKEANAAPDPYFEYEPVISADAPSGVFKETLKDQLARQRRERTESKVEGSLDEKVGTHSKDEVKPTRQRKAKPKAEPKADDMTKPLRLVKSEAEKPKAKPRAKRKEKTDG